MNNSLLKDLQKLAKKYGMTLLSECVYCRESSHSDDSEECFMVTFVKSLKESEDNL